MNDPTPKSPEGARRPAEFADGKGLEPLAPLDLSAVGSFSDLLAAMKSTSFGGRQLGEAADVLQEMVVDPDCLVVGTFTGAMTAAKQGLVLCDMIDHGLLDAIVCTGALMVHGFVESAGMIHFKAPAGTLDDRAAYYSGYDRIYDTLELESNLDRVELIVHSVLEQWPEGEVACSRLLNEAFGRWLTEAEGDVSTVRGVLSSAWRHGVPVYVPAFTDSEIGLDFALFNRARERQGLAPIRFDPFLDLEHYTELAAGAKRLGIFTVGGGVPRNWAQQVAPYLEAAARRAGEDAPPQRFRYGVRICPEPEHWGGLSGCGYSEGVSWGKFVPVEEGGRFAEVPADATLVWPLLVAGVLERMDLR
ncbi:MAG: deoxyhypusine synthase family protein [Acidobacteriota bacterium]|nr:deoxyhypusine synthase family protein [Acidobacteriota bacterium]MDE3266699.1 deoxyhypusine synthase family protein [Acidobacteriota bacterium]